MSGPLWDLDRIPWSSLRSFHGQTAAHVPAALQQLVVATTEDAAREAAWRIDNSVVAQGELYEAAEYVVPFVLHILLGGSAPAQRYALDLLIELTGPAAYVAATEQTLGNSDLLEHCRARAREGLAIGYWLLSARDAWIRGSAVELLDAIETNVERLTWVLRRLVDIESDPRVRTLAHEVIEARRR